MKPQPKYRFVPCCAHFVRASSCCVVPLALLAGDAVAQTTFAWRSEAGNGDWNNSSHWWNGSANSNAGFGVMFFDNNAHLSMNNNMPVDYSTHALRFGAPNNSPRTLAGNTLRLFDFSGADPYIRNESSATHLINLNLEGDGNAGDPLKIQLNSSGGLTFGGTLNNQGSWVDVVGSTTSAATATFNGAISGSGGFFKDNSHTTAILAVANSYSGGTNLAAGTLRLGHDSALGSGPLTIDLGTNNTSKVLASNDASARTLANSITFAGPASADANNRLTLGQSSGGTGSLTLTGGIALGANTSATQNARILQVIGHHTISGAITAAGNQVFLVKQSPGTLTLSGENTFAGNLVIDEGRIRLNGGSLAAGNIFLGGGLADTSAWNASLELASASSYSRNLVVQNHANAGGARELVFSHGSGTATLSGTVDLAKTLDVHATGHGHLSGLVSGTGGISKTGGGLLELSAANTYTGATTVSAGTLAIQGNQSSATGPLSLTGTGTKLMGTGTIGGDTTLAGDTLHAPGNSIGIQSFAGDLDYAADSIFEWEIDRTSSQTRGTGYDAVNVAGALTGSDAIFRIVIGDSDFSHAFWDVSRSWSDIFTAADGVTAKSNWTAIFSGGFQFYDTLGAPVSAPDALTRGSFSFANGNTLVWNAIPEPGSSLITVLLAAGIFRRHRDARCRAALP